MRFVSILITLRYPIVVITIFATVALVYSARIYDRIPSGGLSKSPFSTFSTLGIFAGVGTLLIIPPMYVYELQWPLHHH